MAKNLRAKIADSDSLIVYDVFPAATEKLQKEANNVDVAKSVREVAEKAVRQYTSVYVLVICYTTCDDLYCSINDLSCQRELSF